MHLTKQTNVLGELPRVVFRRRTRAQKGDLLVAATGRARLGRRDSAKREPQLDRGAATGRPRLGRRDSAKREPQLDRGAATGRPRLGRRDSAKREPQLDRVRSSGQAVDQGSVPVRKRDDDLVVTAGVADEPVAKLLVLDQIACRVLFGREVTSEGTPAPHSVLPLGVRRNAALARAGLGGARTGLGGGRTLARLSGCAGGGR